jgi:hypothetical protein
VILGGAIDTATAPRFKVAHGQQQQRALALRHQRSRIFEMQLLPGGMARRQRRRPVGALRHHGLGEDDQGRHLPLMQCADPGLPQQRAVIAEQGAGRRVGIDDPVGVRIEQQRRLEREIEADGARIGVALGEQVRLGIHRGRLRKIVI